MCNLSYMKTPSLAQTLRSILRGDITIRHAADITGLTRNNVIHLVHIVGRADARKAGAR